jgi:hypothetical protein
MGGLHDIMIDMALSPRPTPPHPMVKSLAYALSRNIEADRFVFKRTAGAIISTINRSGLPLKTLLELEELLVHYGISHELIEEKLLGAKFDSFFNNNINSISGVSQTYIKNLEVGLELLNLIRDKKEALASLSLWNQEGELS